MKINFFGATRRITGTCFLVEAQGKRLLVDCGFFQGGIEERLKNYEQFPFEPKDINFVFLTHAHADHIGRVPLLVKRGFSGKIFTTHPTGELFKFMLEDSIKHLKKEAREVKKLILYQAKDLASAAGLMTPVYYDKKIKLNDDIGFRFRNAGHILGSAIVEIFEKQKNGKEKIAVFSGDLGNSSSSLLPPPYYLKKADAVVVEATYGGRVHEASAHRLEMLEDVVEEIAQSEGVLLVPAFSLERIQTLLYDLHSLVVQKKIPAVPVFVDSPLAIRLMPVYEKFRKSYFKSDTRRSFGEVGQLFRFPNVSFTRDVSDSKKIYSVHPPKIIIAGSGMSTGGRIIYHERDYLSEPSTTILFVNYQAEGTLGEKIFKGAEKIEILGETIQVRAKIRTIFGYSAHADQPQLEKWLKGFERFREKGSRAEQALRKIFLVHGEEESLTALAVWARDNLGIEIIIPELGQSFEV